MSAPLLTLDSLRSRFARQPESLIDVVDDIASRFAAFGNAYTSAALRAAASDLLARCPDPSILPLWGMPFVVGCNVDVAGLPTSAGLPALDFEPDFDAIVVERLRVAGALLVGKAPVDPLGLDASAVGVAAAVAAGLAVFGIASDRTGGTACASAVDSGVVAIKPSPGRVASDGLFAIAPELDGVVLLASDIDSGTVVRRVIECVDEHARPAAPFLRLGLLGDASNTTRNSVEHLGLETVAADEAPFIELAALMETRLGSFSGSTILRSHLPNCPKSFHRAFANGFSARSAVQPVIWFEYNGGFQICAIGSRRLSEASICCLFPQKPMSAASSTRVTLLPLHGRTAEH